jgi:hypothetical protein
LTIAFIEVAGLELVTVVLRLTGVSGSVSDRVDTAGALLVLVYCNLTSPIEVVSPSNCNVILEGVGAAVVVVVVGPAVVVVVVVGAAVVVVVVVGAAVVVVVVEVVVVVVAPPQVPRLFISPSFPICIEFPLLAAAVSLKYLLPPANTVVKALFV